MEHEGHNFAFSLKRLETVAKMLQSGLVIVDEHGRIVLLNPAFCQLFDLKESEQELKQKSFDTIRKILTDHIVEPAGFADKMKKITANREILLEKEVRIRNGKTLEINLVPSLEGKNFLGYLISFRNITDEVQTRNQIQHNKEFYEEILDHLPSDVVVLDSNHRYIYINRTAVSNPEIRNWLLGKDDFEFCQKRGKDISLAENRRRLFNQAVENRQPEEFEETAITATGQTEIKLRNLHPVFDERGNLKMVIGYGHDITRRKRVETELEQARKLAENSVAAREILLANVSHELRTPLNGINGILEILMDSGLTESQRNLVQLLQHSSLNLLNLVNDLLNLAQIKRGEIQLKPAPVQLHTLLRNISDIFALQASEKQLGWQFESFIPEDLIIHADRTRLTQILNNLIGNAVKFTEKGRVDFISRIASQNESGMVLEFRVRDTGPGIPERFRDKIFDPFIRLHPDPHQFGGTGLGLNITQNLVVLHGGEIHFETELGTGTEFIVRLPFYYQPGGRKQFEKPFITRILPQKILVIEDHPVNRFLLGNQLETAGHHPVHAGSAAEALQELDKQHFDIILLDFNLPDIPGQELIQMIHQKTGFEKIPVIAVTANAFPETRIAALNAGFAEFISKPYYTDELLKKITWVLGHREA